jgi:hypothetical protein
MQRQPVGDDSRNGETKSIAFLLAVSGSSMLFSFLAIRTKVNDRSDRRLNEAEEMMRALEEPDAFVYQSCEYLMYGSVFRTMERVLTHRRE